MRLSLSLILVIVLCYSCSVSSHEKDKKEERNPDENSKEIIALDKNDDMPIAILSKECHAIFTEAKSLIRHIDLIKAKKYALTIHGPDAAITEDIYKNGQFLIGLDSVKVLAGIDNYEINSDLMIGNPNSPNTEDHEDGNNYTAVVLRDKLTAFGDSLINKSRNLEGGEEFRKRVEGLFTYTTENDVSGQEEEWTVRNFYHVPLAATVAMLSGLQNQVMSGAKDLIELKSGEILGPKFWR